MLHFVTRGRSENLPVLFIHGGGLTGRMWYHAADALPGIYGILPDLPGHGHSAARKLVSLEQAADDLAALLEQELQGRPVDVAGLSLGSYIGLTLMLRYPHLVGRAFLSGLHAGGMPNPGRMKTLLWLMSPLMHFAWFHKQSGKAMGVRDTSLFVNAEGRPNVTPATLRRLSRLVIDFEARPALCDIDIPTLVLAGEKEHPAILQALTVFSDTMPACQAGIVPGLGHAWCAQDPALFVQTLRCWLSAQPLPRAVRLLDGSDDIQGSQVLARHATDRRVP